MSKPVLLTGCKHEDRDPLPLSPNGLKLVTQTWNRIQAHGILMAEATVFRRSSATKDLKLAFSLVS